MVRLSSVTALLAALRSAREITFSSYFVHPGAVEAALEAAAKRGARVHVRVEGDLWGGTPSMARASRQAVRALREAGADAQLVHRADGDGPALHLKAAVCDGVAYLDDCNWNSAGDTVLEDDAPRHVRAVRTAALGQNACPAGPLALTKLEALASETRLLAAARCRHVELETEELHASTVSAALRRLASQGMVCRVLVSDRALRHDPKTRQAARSLQEVGIAVRAVTSSEKFAVAGARAWIGSANATSARCDADQIEWGLHTSSPSIVRAIRSRFESRWKEATPIG